MTASKISLLIFAVLAFIAWVYVLSLPTNKTRQVTLEVMDKISTVELVKYKHQGAIHGLQLQITGKIKGKGILKQGYSDTAFYRIDTISQQIDLNYGSDWYQNNCILIYEPLTAKRGNIAISYKFLAL